MVVAIWLATVLFVVIGSWLALAKRNSGLSIHSLESLSAGPGITVLKPLCGHDPGLRENLESFFHLQYPNFELIFSVADRSDPAVGLVEELQRKYPEVSSWLVIGGEKPGMNPKVNNLVRSYDLATHDLLVISDSNVRVPSSYLSSMASQFVSGVGVITAVVAGVNPRGLGGFLEAMYLNTFYARGMNLAFATGNPCVVGKSMMFRKSVADQFGGIRALANYLAEDYALGEEMRKLGLRVELMRDSISQHIGQYSFSAFWSRHVRWGRIRKAHAPAAFLAEPFFYPIFASMLGAFALRNWIPFSIAYPLNLSLWMGCDLFLMRAFSGKSYKRSPFVWLLRELLAFPLWLNIASGNSVMWRGNRISLSLGGQISIDKGGSIECSETIFSGERQPALTRLRATIRPATGGVGSQKAI